MSAWEIILPIAVGALIGYCTNYIAIKMLFHPRQPIQVFGKTIPFTPGVIPKNQPRIAHAVGRAVGESLLTREDLIGVLKRDTVKEEAVRRLADGIMDSDRTLGMCVEQIVPDGTGMMMERLTEIITGKLLEGVKKIDISSLISETAVPAILDRVQNSMLAMFVNEATITALTAPVGRSMEEYIEKHGQEILKPVVQEEMAQLQETELSSVLAAVDIDRDFVRRAAGEFYEKMVEEKAPSVLERLDIAGLVEQKVKEMDVKALEDLVMSVMKQELQAVINLGAVIGAAIGIINIFI